MNWKYASITTNARFVILLAETYQSFRINSFMACFWCCGIISAQWTSECAKSYIHLPWIKKYINKKKIFDYQNGCFGAIAKIIVEPIFDIVRTDVCRVLRMNILILYEIDFLIRNYNKGYVF